MNDISGFREVRSSTSRSSSYRLLHEQRHQYGKVSWLPFRTLNFRALTTRVRQTSAIRTMAIFVVMQVWLLCHGLEIFAQIVTLEGLEVTQSIQSMSLSTPAFNNAVPMIADKKTVVRAYFSVVGGGPVSLASGALNGISISCPINVNCNVPSVNLAPVIVSSSENGDLRVKRDDITKSLNFELPSDWTLSGTLLFALDHVTGPGGTAITCLGCTAMPVLVTFRSSPPLRLRLIGLQYERPANTPGSTWFEPREEDFALIRSWLKRAYPVAEVIHTSPDPLLPYSPKTYGDLFQDDDGNGTIDEDTCMYAYQAINAFRLSEQGTSPWFLHPQGRTHYYGLISDGTNGGNVAPNFIEGCSSGIPTNQPDPTTTAVGPVGPTVGLMTYGWDTDGSYGDWYAAHELGHTFGRLHLLAGGCATNATDDKDLTVDGRISPNPPTEPYYVGFDSGDSVTLPTSPNIITIPQSVIAGTAYDIMTYCQPIKWINPYTYEKIRERLWAENQRPTVIAAIKQDAGFKIVGPLASDRTVSGEDRAAALRICIGATTDPARFFECLQQQFPGRSETAGMQIVQGNFLNILAMINSKKRTGRIQHVDQIKYIVVRPQTPNKRVQIRVTHQGGKVTNYPVEVRENIDTPLEKRTIGLINAPILFTNKIVKIELVTIGKSVDELEKVLDIIKVTKNPPRVDAITLPNFKNREAFLTGPLTLTWKSQDKDSKTLTYTVQFSSNDRDTWETLGIGLTKPALKIQPRMFKDLIDVKIKVIASDGFNKGEKIVPLNFPPK